MKAKLEKKLDGLIHGLEEIQVEAQAFEERYEVQLRGVHPDQYKSGLNLLHYLALRQRDVSELQNDLGTLGLSRLGRAAPHVLASVHAILHALRSLQGSETKLRKSPVTIKQGPEDHPQAYERAPRQEAQREHRADHGDPAVRGCRRLLARPHHDVCGHELRSHQLRP